MKKSFFGLLKYSKYNYGLFNIGDYIQSCAAEQFLPNVDVLVKRDELNINLNKTVKIIMNGWFTESPENWPPSKNIIPLFISFHLQPKSAKVILSKKSNIKYLRQHSPIGCRDHQTVKMLNSKGINAYYSFCLTSTLDLKYKSYKRNDKIILADPLYSSNLSTLKKAKFKELFLSPPFKKIHKLFQLIFPKYKISDYLPKNIINSSTIINHYLSADNLNFDPYETAKKYIRNYSSARLVVTSRIHCAIPCLALGTPVLFILDGIIDEDQHMSRFRGVLDHINILTVYDKEYINGLFGKKMNVFHPDEIDWSTPPSNPKSFVSFSDKLKESCFKFVDKK